MRKEILMSLGLGLAVTSLAEQKIDVAGATASNVHKNYAVKNAYDGVISDQSRWIGGKDENGKIWLALQLKQEVTIAGIQLHSGYKSADAVDSFYVEIKNDNGEWEKVSGSTVTNNKSTKREVLFGAPVTAKELRVVITNTKDDLARVKEVVLLNKDGAGYSVQLSWNSGDLKVHSGQVTLYGVCAVRTL